MGFWRAVKSWLGIETNQAVVARPKPVSTAMGTQTLSPANGEMLRELSEGRNATAFSSPIVEELSGRLRILARRSQNEPDRLFFGALRRLVLNDGIDMRTMPKAIVPLQRMLGTPDVDIGKLATTLQLEPSIATRVVAISNSSLFGGNGRVTSVADAIIRLGLGETRNIVMAITAHAKLFRMPGHEDDAEALYNHALASAIAGKRIADENGCVAGEEAFIACLLSELGRIVIFTAASDLRRKSRGKIAPLDKTVERTSEDLHGQVSALIAESWGFEEETVSAILHHHHPSSAAPEIRHLSQLMFSADDVAFRVIHPKRSTQPSFGLLSARRAMGITETVDRVVGQCANDFEELGRLIAEPKRGAPPIRGKAM